MSAAPTGTSSAAGPGRVCGGRVPGLRSVVGEGPSEGWESTVEASPVNRTRTSPVVEAQAALRLKRHRRGLEQSVDPVGGSLEYAN